MSKTSRPHVQMPYSASRQSLSFWGRVWLVVKKIWALVLIIGTIIGFYLYKEPIKTELKSEQEKREERDFVKGILIPDQLLYKTKKINLVWGTFMIDVDIEQFKAGEEFSQNLIACKGGFEEPVKMTFHIINNRLVISTRFKDFPSEEIIGEIYKNRWLVPVDKKYRIREDDKYLEVIDKRGRVAFSLVFEDPNTLRYKGYFIGSKFTSVAMDSSFSICIPKSDSSYYQRIDSLVELITPIQNYND